jgi:hypothetical protein
MEIVIKLAGLTRRKYICRHVSKDEKMNIFVQLIFPSLDIILMILMKVLQQQLTRFCNETIELDSNENYHTQYTLISEGWILKFQ